MILKTKVMNLKEETIKCKWIGIAGMEIPAGEFVILEGAYPTACTNKRQIEKMNVEIGMGMVKVSLVTDMNVECPEEEVPKQTPKAKAKRGRPKKSKSKSTMMETVRVGDKKSKATAQLDKDILAVGPIESFRPEAKSIDGEATPQPEVVEIFKDSMGTGVEKGVKLEDVFKRV